MLTTHFAASPQRPLPFLVNGHTVTLMDINHQFFKFLKHVLPRNFGDKIQFKDVEDKLQLEENKYDYIICSEVLEHCNDVPKVLKALVLGLKEGGFMYLSTFFNDSFGSDPSHLKSNTEI